MKSGGEIEKGKSKSKRIIKSKRRNYE